MYSTFIVDLLFNYEYVLFYNKSKAIFIFKVNINFKTIVLDQKKTINNVRKKCNDVLVITDNIINPPKLLKVKEWAKLS